MEKSREIMDQSLIPKFGTIFWPKHYLYLDLVTCAVLLVLSLSGSMHYLYR